MASSVLGIETHEAIIMGDLVVNGSHWMFGSSQRPTILIKKSVLAVICLSCPIQQVSKIRIRYTAEGKFLMAHHDVTR